MPKGTKTAVALSGGVDSATAAALLKEQGADVIALTMLLREGDDAADARRVAEALSIPHHVIDFRSQFAACVAQPFAESYLRGETPNPCALCNRFIKFGALMEAAKRLGAAALATGHYARRVETPDGAQLHRGADEGRDQSYFLFALTQAQIDFLRFPLGEMTKAQTREMAARYALPVANKPDSQDICFVPNGDYVSVLEKLRPDAAAAGEIVDEAGRVLGMQSRYHSLLR
jgi:tRNA-specific 2-thiouridylase